MLGMWYLNIRIMQFKLDTKYVCVEAGKIMIMHKVQLLTHIRHLHAQTGDYFT